MIAPSAVERVARNIAGNLGAAERIREMAETLDLDMQDEATLYRLASGEAMANYYLTGTLADHS